MAGTVTRVTIYDRNLDRLFLPGGDAWDWMERVGREHISMAIIEAPRRSGNLARQHNLALTPYRRGVRYSVGNYAEYAEYVHGGTFGPIVALGGGFMGPLSPWGVHGTAYVREVSGQTANPWIARAADIVLAKYGYTGNPYPA